MARRSHPAARPTGFTLVELVVVIVILGITAVSLGRIFSGSVAAYLDAGARQDRVAGARAALDRLSRELREAMPSSIRVSADGLCLQYLPIAATTLYTHLDGNASSIEVADFTPPGGGPSYVAVYPVDADELYGGTALAPLASIGAVNAGLRTLSLAAPHTFPHQSPGQRLFLVSDPVSVCILAGGELRRYVSTLAAAQPAPAGLGAGSLLLERLDPAASRFSHQLGNHRANALVTVELTQVQNDERLALDHEVRLRNVQ